MSRPLILPRHMAQKRSEEIKEKLANEKTQKVEVKDEEEQTLAPEELKESVREKLPKPTGYRILVLPFKHVDKSKGGILLPDAIIEKESVASTCAYVIELGPLAYKDKEKFPTGPWCKEGEWVLFGRYSGSRIKIEGGELRLLNDDEVLATLKNPRDILHII